MKKIELAIKLMPPIHGVVDYFISTFLSKLYKLEADLAKNDEISYEEKLGFFKNLIQNYGYGSYVMEDIAYMLFETKESRNLSVEDTLKDFLSICPFKAYSQKKIYDLCVASGRVSEDKFPKRNMFYNYNAGCHFSSVEQLDSVLNEMKYRQIGDYYVVTPALYDFDVCFDSQGNRITEKNVEKDKKSVNEAFFDGKSEEKSIAMLNQIDKFADELRVKCKIDEEYCTDVYAVGNIVKIYYVPSNRESKGKEYYKYYSINENGLLIELEPRSEKKIYR